MGRRFGAFGGAGEVEAELLELIGGGREVGGLEAGVGAGGQLDEAGLERRVVASRGGDLLHEGGEFGAESAGVVGRRGGRRGGLLEGGGEGLDGGGGGGEVGAGLEGGVGGGGELDELGLAFAGAGDALGQGGELGGQAGPIGFRFGRGCGVGSDSGGGQLSVVVLGLVFEAGIDDEFDFGEAGLLEVLADLGGERAGRLLVDAEADQGGIDVRIDLGGAEAQGGRLEVELSLLGVGAHGGQHFFRLHLLVKEDDFELVGGEAEGGVDRLALGQVEQRLHFGSRRRYRRG